MKVRSVGVRRVWDCMLCACVSEEGGYGEGVDLEAQKWSVEFLFFTSFFFGTLRGERCNDGTSTEEGLLKREIEDLPVVSSLSFHHAIGRDKAGVRANLRCNVASSHGG